MLYSLYREEPTALGISVARAKLIRVAGAGEAGLAVHLRNLHALPAACLALKGKAAVRYYPAVLVRCAHWIHILAHCITPPPLMESPALYMCCSSSDLFRKTSLQFERPAQAFAIAPLSLCECQWNGRGWQWERTTLSIRVARACAGDTITGGVVAKALQAWLAAVGVLPGGALGRGVSLGGAHEQRQGYHEQQLPNDHRLKHSEHAHGCYRWA